MTVDRRLIWSARSPLLHLRHLFTSADRLGLRNATNRTYATRRYTYTRGYITRHDNERTAARNNQMPRCKIFRVSRRFSVRKTHVICDERATERLKDLKFSPGRYLSKGNKKTRFESAKDPRRLDPDPKTSKLHLSN